MKTQAIVSPTGLLMHHSHCVPGAQHDMSLFRESGLKDLLIKENQVCQNVFHQNCTVLGDSGYQGLATEIQGVLHHTKKHVGMNLLKNKVTSMMLSNTAESLLKIGSEGIKYYGVYVQALSGKMFAYMSPYGVSVQL